MATQQGKQQGKHSTPSSNKKNSNKVKNQNKNGNSRNRNSNRGGKSNGAQQSNRTNADSKEKEEIVKDKMDGKESPSNDVSWYSKNPTLVNNTATFNFGKPTGASINLHYPYGNTWDNQLSIPGLQVIYTYPSIGYSANSNSPVNVAGTALYSWLRRELSGSRPYDPQDAITHLVASADSFSFLEWAYRVYGYSNVWSQQNKYMPGGFFKAEHIDEDDIRRNSSRLVAGLNLIVGKIAQLVAPTTMPLFMQRVFMYAGIYMEGSCIKNQMYMYSPKGFWKYTTDGTWPNLEGKLVIDDSIFTQDAMITVDDILSYGNSLIDALLSQEDIGQINADMIRLFGSNTFKIAMLANDYMINPTTNDPIVLNQMKNCTIIQGVNAKDLVVHQGEGKSLLMYTPILRGAPSSEQPNAQELTSPNNMVLANYDADILLSVDSPAPTPGDIMEITRGAATVMEFQVNSAGQPFGRINCGAFIAVDCRFYLLKYDNTGMPKWRMVHAYTNNLLPGDPNDNTIANVYGIASVFKYHPRFTFWTYDGAKAQLVREDTTFDVDNFGTMTSNDLKDIHEVALLSLLDAPRLGSSES